MGIGEAITIYLTSASAGLSAASAAFVVATLQSVATSLVIGALQATLRPKPKNNLSSFASRAQGINQNINQAVTSRRNIYGEVRVGGALTYLETTDNNKFLHMIVTLADHEVEEIGEIWFDEYSIPPEYLNEDGYVTEGRFADKVRIRKHLGTTSQTVDPFLEIETSVDSNFRGRGVAYIYVRLEYDRNVFPSSIPTITAFVKGKKLYDPRDSSVKFTTNTALIINDYLISSLDGFVPGLGSSQSDINSTKMIAAANVCDEFVTSAELDDTIVSADSDDNTITLSGQNDRLKFLTGDRVNLIGGSLPGGLAASTDYYVIAYQRKDTVRVKLATSFANALEGTAISISSSGSGTMRKVAEPRYHGGGVLESSLNAEENLTDLLSACGGTLVYIGGDWHLTAAAARTATFSFDEDNFLSTPTVRTRVSKSDRFNAVRGTYVSPINDGEATDYPPITNLTYRTEDGEEIFFDLSLPFTQRPHTAQRLAKIALEKNRQEIFFEAEFDLTATQVQPGDVVNISFDTLGWSNKEFEVLTWTLTVKEDSSNPLLVVKMGLQETASSVYDWSFGEETAVDTAANTNLPDPLSVAAPTALNVFPREIATAGGDIVYEFSISWTPPADLLVLNGGYYEVQFKQTSDSEWQRSFRAEDEDTSVTVKQIEANTNYDVRVRSVNNLGVRSSYQTLTSFSIGAPAGVTTTIDDDLITNPVTTSIDEGSIIDSVTTLTDDGTLT